MSTASSLRVSGPLNGGLEQVGPGTPVLPRLLDPMGDSTVVWMSLRLWAMSKADLAVGSLFGGATHAVPHSHGPGGHRASSLGLDVGLASPGRL